MEPRPVVYVDTNGVRAALGRAEQEDAIDLVRAENGADAIKLTDRTGAAGVVVPRDPPDATLSELVDRLVGIDPTVAVIVVGDLPDIPRGVWVVPEGTSPDAAYDRLLSALGDRRIDSALDRFGRLAFDMIRVAETALTAGDRASIERAVQEALSSAPAFRFAWIGRPSSGSIELSVGYPFPGRVEFESVAEAAGVDDGEFLGDALETGSVTVQRATEREGSTRIGGAGEDCRVVAAIPIVHAGQTIGVIVLGTDDPTAFDSTERALLGRMGRLIGEAIGSVTEESRSADPDLDRIGEFVDFFSHEIRNPLSIAITYLELARDEDDDDALSRVAGALESIEDFLDSASTIAKRGGVNEVEEVPLDSFATAAWEALDTPNAELEIVGRPTIRADRVLLDHLFTNLYRNAIQYGGPEVHVRVGALPDDSGFFIEDDGPGIPEDDRDRIFDWGFTTSEDGHGIGLGFVNRVAAAHGWQVDVRDSPDGGARFEVTTEERTESGLDALFDAWEPGADDGSFAFTGSV